MVGYLSLRTIASAVAQSAEFICRTCSIRKLTTEPILVLFTVAALVVTSAFPDKTQALGGAVFQTLAQFGTSLGLAIMASISSSVTAQSGIPSKTSPAALMAGYRVTFWVSFGWVLLAVIFGGVGLRKAGKVGLKRE